MRKAIAASLLLLPSLAAAKDAKPTAEDLVARHLESIGPAEARAAIRSRMAQGPVRFKVLIGGASDLAGVSLFYSEARSLRASLRFGAPDYNGESFGFANDKVDVGFFQPGRRSEIASFLASYDEPLREGLLGGALSTAWPLLELPARGAKLKYDGLKKVDDVELHQLSYGFAKRRSNLQVRLFLEPASFRHLRTTYRLDQAAPMSGSITASSQQQDTRYDLEETFGDFRATDGLQMPHEWTLRFSVQGEGARATLWRFVSRFEGIRQNLATGEPAN